MLSAGYRPASESIKVSSDTENISQECSDLLYSYNIQCEITTREERLPCKEKIGRKKDVHKYKVKKQLIISFCAQRYGPQERHMAHREVRHKNLLLYNPEDGLLVQSLKAKWQKMRV